MIKFKRQDGCCPSAEYNGTIYFIDERELRTSMEGWYLLSRKKTEIYDLGEDVCHKAVIKAMEMLESMGYGKTSFFGTYAMPDVPSASIGRHLGGPTAYVFHNGKNYDLRIVYPECQEAGPFDEYQAAVKWATDWLNKTADFDDPQLSLF